MVNYATVAAPSAKGQLASAHHRGWHAGQQAGEKKKGLSDTCFKGILSKNTTEGRSLFALNCDEHQTILSLPLPSSNLPRTVPQPSILHC